MCQMSGQYALVSVEAAKMRLDSAKAMARMQALNLDQLLTASCSGPACASLSERVSCSQLA